MEGGSDMEESFRWRELHGLTVISPYIDVSNSPNVTVALGKTALLTCRVKALSDRTVAWIRHSDLNLLTVGNGTYTKDARFAASVPTSGDSWSLQIRNVQLKDQGVYECQIGITPHISHFIHLSVVEPTTTILGGPEIYMDVGSTINLTCLVRHSPEPPAHVFWTQNQQTINYDSPRGGISILTEKGQMTLSSLVIQQANARDTGVYQCSPSSAPAATVNIHVLQGERPAAMQHNRGSPLRFVVESHVVAALLSILVAY